MRKWSCFNVIPDIEYIHVYAFIIWISIYQLFIVLEFDRKWWEHVLAVASELMGPKQHVINIKATYLFNVGNVVLFPYQISIPCPFVFSSTLQVSHLSKEWLAPSFSFITGSVWCCSCLDPICCLIFFLSCAVLFVLSTFSFLVLAPNKGKPFLSKSWCILAGILFIIFNLV